MTKVAKNIGVGCLIIFNWIPGMSDEL